MPRRAFLGMAGAAGLGAGLATSAHARPARGAQRGDLTWFGDYDSREYLTYPHSNGFLERGRYVVVGQLVPSELVVRLWARLLVGERRDILIAEFPADPAAAQSRHRFVYWDAHLDSGLMTVACRDQVFVLDAAEALRRRGPVAAELVYPGTGTNVPGTTSIHPDGSRIAFGHITGPRTDPDDPLGFLTRIVEIDLASGDDRVVLEIPFGVSHAHFHPHDPDWIMFNHEGSVGSKSDRVWGYHPTLAPEGVCVAPQVFSDGRPMHLNHERAAHHDDTFVVVQYYNDITDPVLPRGIYEGHLDGRQLRPVAGGVYDHCDISRDGRWAVGDAVLGGVGSVDLIDMTGEQPPQILVDGLTKGAGHPAHIHPVFSPSGEHILFNDTDPDDPAKMRTRVGMVRV